MTKLELKIVNGRLVIDLNKMKDDYSESYGYDGKPSFYDIEDMGCAEVFSEIKLTQSQLDKIMAEYENGGECGWCGDIVSELSYPHIFDYAPSEKMCRNCWEHNRKTYIGSYGEDIGEFTPYKP